MSLTKFLSTISKLFPPPSLSGKEAELSRLDPNKIYVENVRSVLEVTTKEAERICETAARKGIFDRRVEVLCPDGVVAASAESESALPTEVPCWTEHDGQLEEVELPVNALRKRVYYRLHEQPATGANG